MRLRQLSSGLVERGTPLALWEVESLWVGWRISQRSDPSIVVCDGIFARAWSDFAAAPHSPALQDTSTWIDWYRDRFLSGAIPRWTSIDGQGPLDPQNAVVFGPLASDFVHCLAAQSEASFDQFVPLADPNRSESMRALGQSELDGSPWQFDQVGIWHRGELKPSPMKLSTLLGADHVTSTTRLTMP